jgi:cleavage and polyadenylation specificity factor subunit 3
MAAAATTYKRKAANVPPEESDQLIIKPLGAGQEVGRSCVMLEYKGKRIMLDCGIHPGMTGEASLPFFDLAVAGEIDLLLVSHFHLDHCGALPYFLKTSNFRGRCFMTHATKAIYRWLLSDYVKVSNIATDQMLYTEKDIEASMDRIETVNFHQETEVGGIKFWCYNAGHVLGAAMFMIEIAGVKVLYTGDFSRQEDRHLMAAEVPNVHPDVLIIESTYGTHIHEPREERETRFTTLVHDIVNRGGRCLIPVFALGRAQELMLILDEYWSNHPDLHDVPIYYASSLAKKCMSVYQTYINAMNDRIRRQIAVNNPFVFRHISNLKSIDHFEDIGPSVVMASPGMMQSGLSRELFENWCTDRRNGVIVAGYCVEGTLAKHILSEPTEVVSMSGQKLPLRCSVDYISFSAHTDYKQTSEFVRALLPPHIVLVHGEQNEMARLRAALVREYEDAPADSRIEVHSPRNSQAVELTFRGEKMAKVVGRLAAERPTAAKQHRNHKISGILVKRNFSYHIMAAADLPTYTDLAMSTVTQRQSVPYSGTVNQLHYFLQQLSADVERTSGGSGSSSSTLATLQVFGGAVTVTVESRFVVIEWVANPINDMYADAVLAVVLKSETMPAPKVAAVAPLKVDKSHFRECLIEMLVEMFGSSCVDQIIRGDRLKLCVDAKNVVVDLSSLEVQCDEDETLQQMVATAVTKLHRAVTPVQL